MVKIKNRIMKKEYLPVIVKVFEKLGKIDESTKELKKKFLRETLLKQFESDKSNLIEEKDFLNNCRNEVAQLKKKVIDRINLMRHNNTALEVLKIKISNQSKEDRKKAIDVIENEAYELYGENTHITMTEFVNIAKKEMCINDLVFIESVFETTNLIEPQQPEPEEFNLPNISTVEKIIYLNELGIIDFLRTKAKKGMSNMDLAVPLGKITGANSGTIKFYLNKLQKDSETDEKHPYYNKERVVEIKEKLKNWGFKLNS